MPWREIKITDPVFKTCISVIIGPASALNEYLDYWGIEGREVSPSVDGRMIKVDPGDSERSPDSNMTIIWLKKRDIPTLVHEVLHHIVKTFDEKNIPMSWDNTEVMSYYAEYLVGEIIKAWKPKKKRIMVDSNVIK